MTKQTEDAILSLLHSMDKRFDGVDEQLKKLTDLAVLTNEKLTEHDKQFVRIDKQFKKVNAKLIEHDKQFKKVNAKLAEHDKQFEKVNAKLVEHDKQFERVNATLAEHDGKLKQILDDMAPVLEKQTEQGTGLKDHERRIQVLELTKR